MYRIGNLNSSNSPQCLSQGYHTCYHAVYQNNQIITHHPLSRTTTYMRMYLYRLSGHYMLPELAPTLAPRIPVHELGIAHALLVTIIHFDIGISPGCTRPQPVIRNFQHTMPTSAFLSTRFVEAKQTVSPSHIFLAFRKITISGPHCMNAPFTTSTCASPNQNTSTIFGFCLASSLPKLVVK
jgi:hypothetical protein